MKIVRLIQLVARSLFVAVLAIGILVAPAGHSASHDLLAVAAAEAERHAALAAEIAEHGHVHDEGDLDEQNPGHAHGHDSADHLHDKAGVPPSFLAQASFTTREVAPTGVAEIGREAPPFGMKRPPRPSFAA